MPAPWLVGNPAGKPVFRLRCKAVHILRADLESARTAWLDEARNPAERTEREKSSFVLRAQKTGCGNRNASSQPLIPQHLTEGTSPPIGLVSALVDLDSEAARVRQISRGQSARQSNTRFGYRPHHRMRRMLVPDSQEQAVMFPMKST